MNSRIAHKVSFDTTVKAMREFGKDMSSKLKETAMGGLASCMIIASSLSFRKPICMDYLGAMCYLGCVVESEHFRAHRVA
jgi:hypothetical protein